MSRVISTKVGSQEVRRNYTINIQLSTGVTKTVRKLAVSEHHAIDQAFQENIQGDGPYQYDRTKYKVAKRFLKLD